MVSNKPMKEKKTISLNKLFSICSAASLQLTLGFTTFIHLSSNDIPVLYALETSSQQVRTIRNSEKSQFEFERLL